MNCVVVLLTNKYCCSERYCYFLIEQKCVVLKIAMQCL